MDTAAGYSKYMAVRFSYERDGREGTWLSGEG
jgi:hypothetical protein